MWDNVPRRTLQDWEMDQPVDLLGALYAHRCVGRGEYILWWSGYKKFRFEVKYLYFYWALAGSRKEFSMEEHLGAFGW